MTQEQIQKLAEQEYPITTQTMYNEVDDIYVDIDLSEPFRESFIEGYKAAVLQNKGEWISEVIDWCDSRIAIFKNNEAKGYGSELLAIEHYEAFKYFLSKMARIQYQPHPNKQ